MRRDYYISDIKLCINSEIELDSYQNEIKFRSPVMEMCREIFVDIRLSKSVPIPDCSPVYEDSLFREWNSNDTVVRSYPFHSLFRDAIVSRRRGNHIDVYIRKDIWMLNMHTFRIWSYIHLEQILLESDALILHSASIIEDGKAILFSAPSETGKTTQTEIWHRNRPDVLDLNGDRTILKYTPKGWLACGIPISGTSPKCEQAAVPIRAIVMVNRACKDSVATLSPIMKMQLIYEQITGLNVLRANVEKTCTLLEKLLESETIVQLNCTMKDSAYTVLHTYLHGE